MVDVSKNLMEEVPTNIVRGANLESTTNDLLDNFEAGEQKNAKLINNFLEQPFFTGEESLIEKLIDHNNNVTFNDIKKEGINLATLQYNRQFWALKACLDKTNDEFKRAFMTEIYNKVCTKLGGVPGGAAPPAPYNSFNTDCAIPGGTDVLGYFQKVVNYLDGKDDGSAGSKKTIDVLKKVIITNEDLNGRLTIPLNDADLLSAIPGDKKDAFDSLLSFEIGKEANRAVAISQDIGKNFHGLLTNSFPAINTIVGENDKYRYDESKLGAEYQGRLQSIKDDRNLNEKEKKEQINNLRWEFYLKYLKTKNAKIGNALEQLYNNNFDYSKVDRAILKDYLDKVAEIRLEMLFDSGLNKVLGLDWGDINEFKKFYKELADVDPNNPNMNITIPGSTPLGLNIPIQKKFVGGENVWLKDDIEQFGKNAEKSFDALPIEFIINRADIDNNPNLAIEDKTKLSNLLASFYQADLDKYVIAGASVGFLIYLFFVINNRFPITKINPGEQKRIEALFGQAKNSKKSSGSGESGNEASSHEYFKTEIEKLGPGKFENGSEIWLPVGDSELPGGGYQCMKIKITDIDDTNGTFKGTFFGGELEFDRKFEGKSREFKMNKETLDELKTKSKSGKVWLLPNPQESDFNSFRDLVKNEFPFPTAGVTWEDNKFMQKIMYENGKEKSVEAKYFSAPGDDKSIYEVKYNPIGRTFTVSSKFNGEEEGKDGKSEKKRFSYKRDMDWNNFLIFFTQKGLIPQTEEEAKSTIMRQYNDFKIVNGGKWKLNWFTFNNIKHGFKDIFGAIKKKMDEYDKRQDEKFRKLVEGPLLNALVSLPLPASIKNAIGERQQEMYNEELNGAWGEIERYLKALQSDDQFADTFDQVPAHVQTLYGKSYKKFIEDLYKKGNTSTTEKRKAAALLLANYEKGKSPFRGLSEYENKGLWVKILLGEEHYKQFYRDKAACERDRDLAESTKNSGLDKKGLNEQLATCEMDYIINNVRGAYPKLPNSYFPSHEERGINGDKSTNYIPNPSKRLLSETFANKLEEAKKGRFTKDSVNDAYSKNKSINRFEVMEDDFSKMGASRYKEAAGALRRMMDLASDDKLKNRMKKHFLTFLLSGVLDVNCDPSLKKEIYKRAKPMMFVPGLLVKEAGVAENIAVLLDDASGDFSRNVTKYFHKSGQLRGGIDFKGLQVELNNWLTDQKMKELDDYFSKLPTIDLSTYNEPKRSIIEKYQKAMSDSSRDEGDRGILENPNVVSNGLLSSVEVVQKRLNIKNGEFNGKDIDENNNMKEFREKVTKDISSRPTEPRQVAFVLEKFLNRFGIDSQQVYEWIVTADFYNRNQGPFSLPYRGIKLNMGNIGNKEIESILWYAFQGNAWKSHGLGCDRLPPEIFNTLEAFRLYFSKAFYEGKLLDGYVVKKAFKPKAEDTKPLLIGSRSAYDQAFAGDGELQLADSSTSEDDLFSSDDSKKRKAMKAKTKELLKSSDFINSDIVNIEKQLKKNLGGTSKQFFSVTSSHSRTLREEYLRSRLAE